MLSLLFFSVAFACSDDFAKLVAAGPQKADWFSSQGIKRERLFAPERPFESLFRMSVTVDNWKKVHTSPERAAAISKARFQMGAEVIDGEVQARGQSRFNTFLKRPYRFVIGEKNYKTVTRYGAQRPNSTARVKEAPSEEQDARVLIEYTIYKLHEILYPEASVRTRLGIFTFQDKKGKTLDEGFGFFLEGEGTLAKRLNGKEQTSWDYDPSTPGSQRGELFRRFIYDTDVNNAQENFIYTLQPDGSQKRVAYDFDYVAFAPPKPIVLEQMPAHREAFRKRVEDHYKKLSPELQNEFIAEAKHILSHEKEILALVNSTPLEPNRKLLQEAWFNSAIGELKDFVLQVGPR